MKSRKLLTGVVLIALAGAGAWYGWRWYTTPVPPDIPLAGVAPERAEKIEQARQQVLAAPRSGRAWGDLGLTLMANGFFDQAAPCFAHAQRFDAKDPRWPYFYGSLRLLAGQRDGFDKLREALAVARSARERKAVLFPLAQALVENGQLDEAERRAGELRAVEGDGPDTHFVFGVLALARDDRAAARAHLGRLTENPSVRKRACALLAGLTEGDERRAQEYRQRARDLPDDKPWPDSFESDLANYRVEPDRRLAPALELEAQGRPEQAVNVLRELVERAPDEESWAALGFALFKINRFEEAAEAFRRAIGFNPRNPKSYLFLGVSLLQIGEQRAREPDGAARAAELFRRAVEAEDQALALQNDLADAHLNRGRALKHLGRTDEALASLRQAVRVGTEYAEMHQALGEALAEAGQVREGLEHLEDAVRLAKPDDARPRQALEKWKGKLGPKP